MKFLMECYKIYHIILYIYYIPDDPGQNDTLKPPEVDLKVFSVIIFPEG